MKKGPLLKKKASPPALMINYITCLAVLLSVCLTSLFLAGCTAVCVLYLPWCVVPLLITYYNTSNNPFNTLVSVYIHSIGTLFINTIITH